MKDHVLKEKGKTIWAFDLGKGSIGEAVRQGTTFLHTASLLIPADFAETKTAANRRRMWRTRLAHKAGGSSQGDGVPATNSSLSRPFNVAFDTNGNMFIADLWSNRVRKVDTNGIITTAAGGGSGGLGNGGAATNASLNGPADVAFDRAGNLLIADSGNNRIRKVNSNGIITTIAGGGAGGLGDGGPATNASISSLQGIALDALGNLYIADYGASRVLWLFSRLTRLSSSTAKRPEAWSCPRTPRKSRW